MWNNALEDMISGGNVTIEKKVETWEDVPVRPRKRMYKFMTKDIVIMSGTKGELTTLVCRKLGNKAKSIVKSTKAGDIQLGKITRKMGNEYVSIEYIKLEDEEYDKMMKAYVDGNKALEEKMDKELGLTMSAKTIELPARPIVKPVVKRSSFQDLLKLVKL